MVLETPGSRNDHTGGLENFGVFIILFVTTVHETTQLLQFYYKDQNKSESYDGFRPRSTELM